MSELEVAGATLMAASLILILLADHFEHRRSHRCADALVALSLLAFIAGVYFLEPFTRS